MTHKDEVIFVLIGFLFIFQVLLYLRPFKLNGVPYHICGMVKGQDKDGHILYEALYCQP